MNWTPYLGGRREEEKDAQKLPIAWVGGRGWKKELDHKKTSHYLPVPKIENSPPHTFQQKLQKIYATRAENLEIIPRVEEKKPGMRSVERMFYCDGGRDP